MTSPFVKNLLLNLEKAIDPEVKAIIRAELGCYWARVGEFDLAERIRQDLRAEFGDARSVQVSILIMVLEALQLYYRDLSPSARDRMQRANLLSKSFREKKLIALTSAWMAHIELNGARFDRMIAELQASFAAVLPGEDGTLCRVSLVLGDAYLIAGLPSQSQVWYEEARLAANRLGDHAAVGAMTYNRAALRVARCRYERISTGSPQADLSLLRLDVESAINYQSLASLRSLEHLLTTTKVGLMLVKGDARSARPLIEALLASAEVPAQSTQRILLTADYAFTLATEGELDAALRQIETIMSASLEAAPSDDLSLILGSLRDAAELCGRDELRVALEQDLRTTIEKHERVTSELRLNLVAFEASSKASIQAQRSRAI